MYISYKETYNQVKDNLLYGRIAMTEENSIAMMKVVHIFPGDHIEIGTLWGGSAILAYRAMQVDPRTFPRTPSVFCVDPLDGYYGNPTDPVCEEEPTVVRFMENVNNDPVAGRGAVHIHLIPATSQDVDLSGMTFGTALIDGDHSLEGAMHDFNLLKDKVVHRIMFDNYNDVNWPDVTEAVNGIILSGAWKLDEVHSTQTMAVLQPNK